MERVDHRERPRGTPGLVGLEAASAAVWGEVQQRNPVNEYAADSQRQRLPSDQHHRVRPDGVERHEQEQDRGEMVAEVGHLVLRIEEQATVQRLPDDVVHDAKVIEVAVTGEVTGACRHAEQQKVRECEKPDRAGRCFRGVVGRQLFSGRHREILRRRRRGRQCGSTTETIPR